MKFLTKLLELLKQTLGEGKASPKSYQGWGQKQTVGANGRGYLSDNRLVRPSQTSKESTHRYTTSEVKACLRGEIKGVRANEVMLHAAKLASLLDVRMRKHFRGRERLFDRLPYVLFQYTSGKPADEIAHSVSYFSDGCDVEDAITFAAELIARRLNRGLHA